MPGFKNFVAGEEATAADVNGYLMGQAVARFANPTARSAAITAPALNQLSVLDSRAGYVQYWNGSAWVDLAYVPPTPPVIPPSPLPSNLRIEVGSVVTTTDATGGALIYYGTPFSSGAVAVVAMDGDDRTVAGGYGPIGFNVSAAGGVVSTNTYFAVRCVREGAIWVQNGTVRLNYIAIGPR